MQCKIVIRKGWSAIERYGRVTLRVMFMNMAAGLLVISGCASLPDTNRLQNNMDAMVHYMGVMAGNMPIMANSTARMAQTAERMERKSDALLNDLQKKGGAAERTIQNYSQALLDNERAIINNLKGIRGELGELKQSLGTAQQLPRSGDHDRVNAQIMARLASIENRLTALTSRMEQMDRQTTSR